MPCYVLCQSCGAIFDTGAGTHICGSTPTTGFAGFCEYCGHQSTDLTWNETDGVYGHQSPYDCIKNIREYNKHEESHTLDNDSRLFELEKTVKRFMEGRKAALAGTKAKHIEQERVIRQEEST